MKKATGGVNIYPNTRYLAGLANNDQNTLINPLEGTEACPKRRRTLDIAIVNGTGDDLRLVEEYFYSGSWYVSPNPVNVPPGAISIGYAASRPYSIFGVIGGLMYELAGKGKYVYIGFANPTLGYYKTFVELSNKRHSAVWACKQLKDDTTKNRFDGTHNILAEIKTPKVSKFRLFRYTVTKETS